MQTPDSNKRLIKILEVIVTILVLALLITFSVLFNVISQNSNSSNNTINSVDLPLSSSVTSTSQSGVTPYAAFYSKMNVIVPLQTDVAEGQMDWLERKDETSEITTTKINTYILSSQNITELSKFNEIQVALVADSWILDSLNGAGGVRRILEGYTKGDKKLIVTQDIAYKNDNGIEPPSDIEYYSYTFYLEK